MKQYFGNVKNTAFICSNHRGKQLSELGRHSRSVEKPHGLTNTYYKENYANSGLYCRCNTVGMTDLTFLGSGNSFIKAHFIHCMFQCLI
jgi:hypothetical protein